METEENANTSRTSEMSLQNAMMLTSDTFNQFELIKAPKRPHDITVTKNEVPEKKFNGKIAIENCKCEPEKFMYYTIVKEPKTENPDIVFDPLLKTGEWPADEESTSEEVMKEDSDYIDYKVPDIEPAEPDAEFDTIMADWGATYNPLTRTADKESKHFARRCFDQRRLSKNAAGMLMKLDRDIDYVYHRYNLGLYFYFNEGSVSKNKKVYYNKACVVIYKHPKCWKKFCELMTSVTELRNQLKNTTSKNIEVTTKRSIMHDIKEKEKTALEILEGKGCMKKYSCNDNAFTGFFKSQIREFVQTLPTGNTFRTYCVKDDRYIQKEKCNDYLLQGITLPVDQCTNILAKDPIKYYSTSKIMKSHIHSTNKLKTAKSWTGYFITKDFRVVFDLKTKIFYFNLCNPLLVIQSNIIE